MDGDGFFADAEALAAAAGQAREASSTLAEGTLGAPPTPDAGASSAALGAALQRVQTTAVVLSAVLSRVADKVDVTRGSYAEIDNTAAGMLRWENRPADQHPLTTFAQDHDFVLTSPTDPQVDNGTHIDGHRTSGPR